MSKKKKKKQDLENIFLEKFHIFISENFDSFHYQNVHMSGMGISGQPDIMLKIKEIPHTFYLEGKRATSLTAAISGMRPSQKGYFKKMRKADMKGFLIWDGGCAHFDNNSTGKVSKEENWILYPDQDYAFEGFMTMVSHFKEGKL